MVSCLRFHFLHVSACPRLSHTKVAMVQCQWSHCHKWITLLTTKCTLAMEVSPYRCCCEIHGSSYRLLFARLSDQMIFALVLGCKQFSITCQHACSPFPCPCLYVELLHNVIAQQQQKKSTLKMDQHGEGGIVYNLLLQL